MSSEERWWEEDDEEDEEDEEVEEVVFEGSHRNKIVKEDETRWALTYWADRAETARKRGDFPGRPPFEILFYPDLFERAYGWDTILPYFPADSLPVYKEYLSGYYDHNHKNEEDDDHGNGLAALAHSCIDMEGHLLFLWKHHPRVSTADDQSHITLISDKITKRALDLTNSTECDFPVAAIAFKCITKEAELMCGCLLSGINTATYFIEMCNKIRLCALTFMTYKGPEYKPAAATMMAITQEAKLVCELLKKKDVDCKDNCSFNTIRNCTLHAMLRICAECSAAEEPTGRGNSAGKLIIDESDGENCSEKENVKPDNLNERKEINQNKEDLVVADSLLEIAQQKDKVLEHDVARRNKMEHAFKLGDLLKGRLSPFEPKKFGGNTIENESKRNQKAGCFSWVVPGMINEAAIHDS